MPSALPDTLTSLDPFILLAEQIVGEKLDPAVRRSAIDAVGALELPELERGLRAAALARVLSAFIDEGVSEDELSGTTGYGYHDAARARYESLIARIFRAEKALARLSLVSGTHAIMATLSALCGTQGTLVSAAGRPYDTLRNAIVDAPGSLVSQGVRYVEVALGERGRIDLNAYRDALDSLDRSQPPVIFVQRSRGYASRAALSIDDIEALVLETRALHPAAIIAVDNCYCELVESREPLEVGADLVIGSLIKNLGGGIAPAGAYVAGKSESIEIVARRVYAPGLGDALGPTLGMGRLFLQGLFNAPTAVWETIRGLNFAAALFDGLGVGVDPVPLARRSDIVQAICLENREALEAFAHALQLALPVNRRFRPEPGAVPGYRDPVIMSSGSFIGGATIELSCDAPLRAPYEVYLQGGLFAEHAVVGCLVAAHKLFSAT